MKTLLTTLGKNQNVLIKDSKDEHIREFWSYDIKIAEIRNGETTIDQKYWKWSKTTLKYLCQFLSLKNKKAIDSALASGEIKKSNLQ